MFAGVVLIRGGFVMNRPMMFLFDGDDIIYVERFEPLHPRERKSFRVRRQMREHLMAQGKTKEEIESIFRSFGI